jgi:ABC-type transport system substrate-binding protein
VQAYDGPLLEQDYGRIAYQDLFTDSDGEDWFVVRSSDSNGYTTGRAYRTGDYGDGYVAGSPDEICYMVLRRPGDVADTGVHSTDGHETDHSQIVPQLRENAEAFEYTIGKQGASLTHTTIGGPLTFNLALANDSSSSGVLGYLFEGLTEVSWLTGWVEPGLAEQWEHSADGLTWTFYLRREVQWQDGEEFTAEDVVFTFNRIIYNDDIDNPDVRRYEYDITQANAILDCLGWVDTDGDGIREDNAGNPIRFTMATNDGNTVRQAVGTIIHQGLQAVGIGAGYEIIGFGEIVSQLTSSYDWEAILIGFGGGIDPYGGIVLWHSSEDLHLWYPNQPQPMTDWEAEIDELYIKASQELDHDQRVEYYHRAQEIVAENVPVVYTVLGEGIIAVRNVFGNTTATLYGWTDVRYLYRTDQ